MLVTFLLIAGITSQSNVQTTPNPKSSAESTAAHSTVLQGDTQGKNSRSTKRHAFILGDHFRFLGNCPPTPPLSQH